MTRIEQSVIIPAPPDKVFAYAADYRKWSDWFEGVSRFVPLTETTQGNGARYAYRARMLGIPIGVETEIRDYRPNQGWHGVSTKGVAARTFWDFQPAGNGTRFTYALEYDLPLPWLSALADLLLMKPQWKRIIAKSLENLKGHFSEGESTATGPGV